jgi:hypothetical protein
MDKFVRARLSVLNCWAQMSDRRSVSHDHGRLWDAGWSRTHNRWFAACPA